MEKKTTHPFAFFMSLPLSNLFYRHADGGPPAQSPAFKHGQRVGAKTVRQQANGTQDFSLI